jgi:dihydropteroate synthase
VSGDQIRLRGLAVDALIGVYPHEEQLRQRLLIDLDLTTDLRSAGASDDVARTVDYDRLAAIARQVATARHHRLIEAVAEEIARRILEEEAPRVRRVRVRVAKPGAVRDAERVAVEVSRSAPRRPRRLVLRSHALPLGQRPLIMGIVNATPDSFYDRGRYFDPSDPGPAVRRALELIAEGADLIDIGGETAQPSSPVLDPAEEIRRVVPVIAELAFKTDRPISVDTYKPAVAEAALAAGASLINDTTGLVDPRLAQIAADSGAGLVIMHIPGHPKERINPGYPDPVGSVGRFLADKSRIARRAGLSKEQILLDPGIGFGKTAAESLELTAHFGALKTLGHPLLYACSRRTFLGELLGGLPPEDRLEATAAVNAAAMLQGADVIRVHDVRFFARMSRVMARLVTSG